MQAQPHIFRFNNRADIRVVTIDGDPWFVAVDVYEVLFGRRTGINATATIGKDEYRTFAKASAPDALRSAFEGRAAHLALLSESGLYKLVLRSDKPEAKEFQDWVTRVVLPAIRKDGGFIAGEEKVVTGEMSEDERVLVAGAEPTVPNRRPSPAPRRQMPPGTP